MKHSPEPTQASTLSHFGEISLLVDTRHPGVETGWKSPFRAWLTIVALLLAGAPFARSQPPVTAGLVLRLDSTQGVTATGATVTAWADQSGNGNDIAAVNDPQVGTVLTPLGLPAISLDGADDVLQRTATLTGLPAGNADRTIFLVAKYNSTTAWAGFAYGTADDNQTFGLAVTNPAGDLVLSGFGSGNDLVSSIPGIGAGWMVQSGLVSSNTATHFKNGNQIGQFTHSYNTVIGKLVIGAEIGNAGFAGMDVAALLIYDRALTPAERVSVESYLQSNFLTATAPPVITVPGNITAEATAASGAVVNFTTSAIDHTGANVATTNTPASGSLFPLGTTTVTVTATDTFSNSATSIFTVTVQDTTPPVITVPTNMTVEATGPGGAVVSFATSAIDTVDGSVATTDSPASGAAFPLGVNTVTVTATDAAGNPATASFTVTVSDTTPPVITAPANITAEATGPGGAVVNFATSAIDSVDGSVATTNSPASGSLFPLGVSTVTVTATDVAGNPATASFTITVSDTTPPVITVPANMTVEATVPGGAVVNFATSAIDIVDGSVATTNSPASGSNFPLGVNTVTVTATDAAGNPATASFTVTVNYSIPVPVTAGLVLRLDATLGVTATGATVTAWADQSGNGNDVLAVNDPQVGAVLTPLGLPAISLDGGGDVLQRTATLTGLPVGSADRTIFLVAKYNSTTAWAGVSYGTADDNQTFGLAVTNPDGDLVLSGYGSGNDLVSAEPGIGAGWMVQSGLVSSNTATHFKNGTQIGQFTHAYNTVVGKLVIGAEIGNAGFAGMDVAALLIYDRALSPAERADVEAYLQSHFLTTTAPPVITVPANLTVEATAASGAVVNFTTSAIDHTGANVATTNTPASGSVFPLGTTTVTVTATDTFGNSASSTFTVTVQDTTPPVITVPTNMTVEATGPGGAVVSFATSAIDSVDGSVATTDSPASGAAFPLGVNTVTVTATDVAGNPATASFTVTVSDTTPPVITVPANITAEATGPGGAVVNFTTSAIDSVDGSVATTDSPASGSTFPLGVSTVTVTATDGAGNPATASFTVTVGDTTPPVITVPANITVEATGPSGAVVVFATSAVDSVDGSVATTDSPASGSNFPLGVSTVTVTATDVAGNPATANFTVTISDTTPPVITVPANITAEATGPGGAVVNFATSAIDSVDGSVATTDSPASGSLFPLGVNTVTVTATDAAGNPATASFTITVSDTSPPVITVPVNITAEATGPGGAVVSFATSAVDSVDGSVATTNSPVSGSLFPLGVNTVTVTAMDAAGNPATASFTVTVSDTTPPVITVPANITAEATGPGGAVVVFATSAVDSVDGSVATTNSPASGSLFPLGVNTVTVTATDVAGNPASSTFTVTIVNPLPVTTGLVLRLDSTQGVTATGATVTAWADQSGNGNDVLAVSDPQVGAVLTPLGLPAISLDGGGDVLQRTATLTGLPAGSADRTIFLVAKYNSTTAWAGAAYGTADNNQTFGLGVTNPEGNLLLSGYGSGNDLVSSTPGIGSGWMVQSGLVSGNSATHFKNGTAIGQFTHAYDTVVGKLVIGAEIGNTGFVGMDVAALLIYDRALSPTERADVEAYLQSHFLTTTAPPVITVPANLTVEATAASGAVVNFTTSAIDHTGANVATTNTPASGSLFPLGTTTVTVTATDTFGNSASSTFTVTVQDTTPPVITVPPNMTVEATGPGGAVVSFATSAIDSVDGSVATTDSPVSGAAFPLGVNTVTVTATDVAGNPATASFTVTVSDTTPPVITVPANITAEATGPGGSVVNFATSAIDIVDGSVATTNSPASGSLFPLGVNTVTVTATDAAGNPATASFTVTVGDTNPPVITVPANMTVEATGLGGSVVNFATSAIDSVDGSVATTDSPVSGATFPLGVNTVTVTATDVAGNPATASFTVTVQDTTPPVITVPPNMTVEATGPGGAVVVFATSAIDSVDGSVATTDSPASGAAFPLGVNTVTVTATDGAGNPATASFTVTVQDTTPPVITVPPNMTVEATGPGGAVVNFTTSAVDSVDGSVATINTPASGSTFPIGVNTVTVSATDAAGNPATASFTVTVSDTPPVNTPIENWRLTFYGTTANTGNAADLADPYHTGIPNLVVFALLGPTQDPSQARTSQLPQIEISGGNAFLNFTQPPGVSGITYGAEWSSTLLNDWQSISDTGVGSNHVFSVPTAGESRIFMRFKITNP